MSHPENRNSQEAQGFSNEDIRYMRSFTDAVYLMSRDRGSEYADSWHSIVSNTVDSYFNGIRYSSQQGNNTEAIEAVFVAESLGMGVTEPGPLSRISEALGRNTLLSSDQKQQLLDIGEHAASIGLDEAENSTSRQKLTDLVADAYLYHRRSKDFENQPDTTDIYEVSLIALSVGINAPTRSADAYYGELERAMLKFRPGADGLEPTQQ